MKKLIVLAILVGISLAGLNATVNIYLDKTLNLEDQVLVEVKRGASLHSVAGQLAKNDMIVYPRVFVKVGQFYGYGKSIKYGEYLFKSTDTYKDVLEKLSAGKNHQYKVTFVEGEHMYHYAGVLEKSGLCPRDEFLQLVKDRSFIRNLLSEDIATLEGYLFPETYSFSKSDNCKKIISTMVWKFLDISKPLVAKSQGLNRHEVVTLASIVEKETGAAFERPMISSVFHNRLKKRMRLQTDPTIIYGILNETGKEITNIRTKDLRRPTAYNTYVIKGLPPGPIGNPGLEAIKAAVQPKETPFLYFVSQNDGTHIFSETYEKHRKAVNKYQKDPKMRQGKSWRDLKNKRKQQ